MGVYYTRDVYILSFCKFWGRDIETLLKDAVRDHKDIGSDLMSYLTITSDVVVMVGYAGA
jgi:hypothetical protein